MKTSAFLLACLGAISVTSASHIEVAHPKPIAAGCLAWIDTQYKWDECKGMKKKALTKCACKSEPMLESTVRCMDALIPNATFANAKKLSYKALVKTCEGVHMDIKYLEQLSEKAASLPVTVPKTKGVKEPFALADINYYWAYVANYNTNENNPRSILYDGNILSYWLGVFVLRTIYNIFCVLLTRFGFKFNTRFNKLLRKNISLPALFGYSHSTTPTFLRFFTFNIPTRGVSIIIAGYFVVNWVLLFSDLPLYNAPSPSYPSYASQVSKMIATRSGFAVVMQLPLIFLFGGRNNFLLWITGWPLDTFNVFHKWVGRIMFLNLVCHAGTYTKFRASTGRYQEMWSTPYWNWGIAGIFMAAFTVGVGVHWFRRLNYELFVILHIIGAVMMIVAGYHHLDLINEDLEFFYAIWAVWIFDRLVRAIRVIVSNPFARATVKAVDQNTLEYTIRYSGAWKPFAGSYVFIHMLQPTFFWESHPFSLMEATKPEEEGMLKLYLRTKDGMTKRAMDKAVSNGGQFESYIWLDGPYGVNYHFNHYDNMVFLAGGVGITAVYSCVQQIIKSNNNSRVVLYWGIMTEAPLEWFATEFDHMLKSGQVEINLFIGTGAKEAGGSGYSSDVEKKSVNSGKSINRRYHMMDAAFIVEEEIQNAEGNTVVFSCGPPGLNDTARKSVAQHLEKTNHYVEYFEESFSW